MLEIDAIYYNLHNVCFQNVGDDCAQKPNPEAVHVDSSEAGEKLNLVPKKESSGRSSREDRILNSPLTTKSKVL
jgi:hypothetical protein